MQRSLAKTLLIVCLLAWQPRAVAQELPEVLIIGDSISLGYTPHVRRLLLGKANVVHHKGNAQHTGTGLERLDGWLGDTPWDVIHFNWGLWDLCYRHPDSTVQGNRDKIRGTLTTSLENYERNLDELVRRLLRTNAELIWGSTTVVPDGEAGRRRNDDVAYNRVAERVMRRHGIQINDLNKVSRTIPVELFSMPGDVHFRPEGYQRLGQAVAMAIRKQLDSKAAELNTKALTRIHFGSCIRQDESVPILDTIVRDQPELFIFLGDNIYGDTEDMSVLKNKYRVLAQKPEFQRLQKSCPVLATWDDHDYGVNDGGAAYPQRQESRRIFLEFWRPHAVGPPTEGIYEARVFGPVGRQIQVILLDTRYFRSPLKKGEKRVGGSWVPDSDHAKTMLGSAQWKWLENQLRQPAELRVIASSIQFIAEDAGQESWSNLPLEKSRMLGLLRKTKAGHVVFISGDRHWSEISVLKGELSTPLFDITSSSLNQIHGRGTPTRNRFRQQPSTYHRENFGVLSIDWAERPPSLKCEIVDLNGKTQIEHTLN